MRWKEFLHKRQLYKKSWDALKESYQGDVRQFLGNSRLVIAYGPNMAGQFDYKNKTVASIAMDHLDFFVKDSSGNRLSDLVKQYEAIKDQDTDLKSKIIKQLEEFDTEFLSVTDNQAEIRFPAVNIWFIQHLKTSQYCDKKRTSMSESSIRVVLKTGE